MTRSKEPVRWQKLLANYWMPSIAVFTAVGALAIGVWGWQSLQYEATIQSEKTARSDKLSSQLGSAILLRSVTEAISRSGALETRTKVGSEGSYLFQMRVDDKTGTRLVVAVPKPTNDVASDGDQFSLPARVFNVSSPELLSSLLEVDDKKLLSVRAGNCDQPECLDIDKDEIIETANLVYQFRKDQEATAHRNLSETQILVAMIGSCVAMIVSVLSLVMTWHRGRTDRATAST